MGASYELDTTWSKIDKNALCNVGSEYSPEWYFGPADSPWQQGAVESMIKNAKRCIHYAIADTRLSASEFSTVCAQVSNMLNERPLATSTSNDSEINVLTPNCLLLGRPVAAAPPGKFGSPSLRKRCADIDGILDDFWKRWVEFYAPTMVRQNKWSKEAKRDLKVGDVVSVADSNMLRGQYFVARVVEVKPGSDGRVRHGGLEYKRFRVGSALRDCSGCPPVKIYRSVQRLALLLPVEEQGGADKRD